MMTKSNNNDQPPRLQTPAPRPITEYVRESQFLLWLWNAISEISFGWTYEEYLRDGAVLLRLISNLSPDSDSAKGHTATAAGTKEARSANIEKFLNSCRRIGLDDDELFDVEDLVSMLDIPRVTRCLFALGKYVAEKRPGIPALGEPYDQCQWLQTSPPATTASDRRMPQGDDLLVSHVNTEWVKKRLEHRRRRDAQRRQNQTPRDPLVQRTPSKPLAELRALFVDGQAQPKPEPEPIKKIRVDPKATETDV